MSGELTGETPTTAGGGGSTSGGNSGGGESQRSLPTPFLTKTYQLVDDSSLDDLISWNDDGTNFIVWRPDEFARDLLPKYFKHNNFSSFVRQLNTYGFRKVVPDRWEFSNDFFRRGGKTLLRDIQRRKISQSAVAAANAPVVAAAVTIAAAVVPQATRTVSPSNSGEEQVISSNSSPAAMTAAAAGAVSGVLQRTTSCTTAPPELMEENERLRKENIQLSQELTKIKGLYENIYTLMTNYAGQGDSARTLPQGKPLDLLPGRQAVTTAMAIASRIEEGIGMKLAEDLTPRLFGVSIGLKRARREDELGTEGEDDTRQLMGRGSNSHEGENGIDIKTEAVEETNSNDHNCSWLELGK